MADDNTQATGANTPAGEGTTQAGAAGQPGSGTRTFTQEELDAKVKSRLERERAKYADYDDLKAAAKAHADYDAVVAERDALKATAERAELVGRVAAACGVPVALVSMLSGTTEEELTSQAAELAKATKSRAYPNVDDHGSGKPAITADDIRKIKDPRERIRARAAHPELFQ